MYRYNKLLTAILDSSIWLEDSDTRIVWITLLATMDEDGFCPFPSPAKVAIFARVPLAIAIAALKKFEGPGPLAPEHENQGRWIERVPGGYIVLNAIPHREQVTREEIRRQNAERAKRYRERKKKSSTTVTPDRDAVTEGRDAEETEGTDITTPPPSRENLIRRVPFTQSVSEAEAKQLQKQGRAAAKALAEETLQRAKARAKEPRAHARASVFPPSVVERVPVLAVGLKPQRDSSSLFPRRALPQRDSSSLIPRRGQQVLSRPRYPQGIEW